MDPSTSVQQNNSSHQICNPAIIEQIFRCSACRLEFASNADAAAHLSEKHCDLTSSSNSTNSTIVENELSSANIHNEEVKIEVEID